MNLNFLFNNNWVSKIEPSQIYHVNEIKWYDEDGIVIYSLISEPELKYSLYLEYFQDMFKIKDN